MDAFFVRNWYVGSWQIREHLHPRLARLWQVHLLLRRSLKLSPSESHIFKTVSQELCPSDGRSCYIAADGRRPCESARRCQAFLRAKARYPAFRKATDRLSDPLSTARCSSLSLTRRARRQRQGSARLHGRGEAGLAAANTGVFSTPAGDGHQTRGSSPA